MHVPLVEPVRAIRAAAAVAAVDRLVVRARRANPR
jgi:hypothetical protein